jgi:hypothetical protein
VLFSRAAMLASMRRPIGSGGSRGEDCTRFLQEDEVARFPQLRGPKHLLDTLRLSWRQPSTVVGVRSVRENKEWLAIRSGPTSTKKWTLLGTNGNCTSPRTVISYDLTKFRRGPTNYSFASSISGDFPSAARATRQGAAAAQNALVHRAAIREPLIHLFGYAVKM